MDIETDQSFNIRGELLPVDGFPVANYEVFVNSPQRQDSSFFEFFEGKRLTVALESNFDGLLGSESIQPGPRIHLEQNWFLIRVNELES
jgi:hypothetical protein